MKRLSKDVAGRVGGNENQRLEPPKAREGHKSCQQRLLYPQKRPRNERAQNIGTKNTSNMITTGGMAQAWRLFTSLNSCVELKLSP